MKIEICPATIADSAGIAHVQITSYRTAYAPFFPRAYIDHFTYEEQTQDWRDLMSAAQHDPLLVAVREPREIFGYALGNPVHNEFGSDVGELVALHVLPQYQRKGTGSRLFAAMARELQERGNTALILWTIEGNPVRSFYERLGGVLAGKKSYDVDDMTVTEVAYRWKNIDGLIERLDVKSRYQ